MIRRWYKLVLVCIIIFTFTSCLFNYDNDISDIQKTSDYMTNRENGSDDVNSIATEFYEAEKSALDFNGYNFSAHTKQNAKLYVCGYIGDEKTKTFDHLLMIFNDQGTIEQSIPISGIPNYMIKELAIDSKQNIWALVDDVSNIQNTQEMPQSSHLIKFDQNGTILSDQSLKDLVNPIQAVTYENLVSNHQDSIFLIEKNQQGEKNVLIFNEDGTIQQTITALEQIVGLLEVDEKMVYAYTVDDKGTIRLSEIQNDAKVTEQMQVPITVTGVRKLLGGMDGSVLAVTNTALWRCTVNGSEQIKLFEWLDKGIELSKWMIFEALSEEKIIGISAGFTDLELLQITKKQNELEEEFTILTLASLKADDQLKKEIAVFNQNHERCVIKLKQYYDPYATGSTIEDALERLNADLLANSAGDLLDVKSLNEVTLSRFYVKRGLLENLYNWMEQDDTIKRDCYTEAVWKANEVEGGLYSLIPTFSLKTMMGKKSQVGEGFSWTPEQMKETMEKYPEMALYSLETRESFLQYMCQYDMDEFVNWETGECDFSKQSFAIFLVYAKSLPEHADESIVEFNELYDDRAVLYDKLNIDGTLTDFLGAKRILKEDVSLIGFPVGEGIGALFDPGVSIGLCSQSAQKETAWKALSYFLTEEYQQDLLNRDYRSVLPVMETVRQSVYEMIMQDERQAMSGIGSAYGGWEIKFGYPTEQEINEIEQLIHSTTKVKEMDQTISRIIMEEAAAYFSDQKDLEETVALIQNRVSIYVKESK